MRQGCSLSPLLFNIVLEFLAREIRQEHEIKGIQIGKEEIKLSLFVDVMVLCQKKKKKKNSTKKTLRKHKLFWQSSRIQINIQKLIAFLYNNNEQTEKEIRETIPFIIASKNIKYLGINLTKNFSMKTVNYRRENLKKTSVD
jgi:hypothetical protein